MDIKSRVALRIKTIRKARGLTQEDLAAMIERSVDAISNIERGISLAGYDTLDRLALGLNVPIAEFFAEPESEGNHRTESIQRLVDAARALDDADLEKATTIIEVMAGRK